jgi:4-amino-4-deoxy-L-arabinose transferase-like glycosyltransferase
MRITDSSQIVPTYIRLPGYPAFLAIVFAMFGRDNFRAVLLLQVLIDIGTCFVTADLARRMLGNKAAKAAFLLTALCPFLANYSAAALTETLEVFFTAAALDFAAIGLTSLAPGLLASGGRGAAWLPLPPSSCVLMADYCSRLSLCICCLCLPASYAKSSPLVQ